MRTWAFTYAMSHESYSGNTHQDGDKEITASGRTYESARRKAEKQIEKECRGTRMEARLKFVKEL